MKQCGLAFLFLLFFSMLGAAQTASTGALTGTVTDKSGAIVPAVKIDVTNESTGETRSVTSQENGSYVFPLLLPASYRVEFSKPSFATAVKRSLPIIVTETVRLDVQLEVGGVQQEMTITAASPLLQTESAALGQ